MTKTEILEFIRVNNPLLEGAWNPDRPPYRFRYDEEADIVMLEIYDKWLHLRKSHAIAYEDIDESWLWHKVHRVIDLFIKLCQDWTDLRRLPNGQLAW